MTSPPEMSLRQRLTDLTEQLGDYRGILVAFSGGADSAFLLAAAARSEAEVLAATSTSASLASGEWAAASKFARNLGVEHIRIDSRELDREGYRANGPDRCYHCKSELLDILLDVAQQRDLAAVATGTNADDVAQEHRPGLLAAQERKIVTPLADVGFSKTEIREASRLWGLSTWDKPQAACLASRIAYGVSVDEERLRRIDRAEVAVRAALGRAGITSTNLRVRDRGDSALIEVDYSVVAEAMAEPTVVTAALEAGFSTAEIDPRGFRSGSMNSDLLPEQQIRLGSGVSSWNLPLVD